MMVLRAKVARIDRSLCTCSPSAVKPVVCILTAAGERCACTKMLVRSASSAASHDAVIIAKVLAWSCTIREMVGSPDAFRSARHRR
jgi:hypothetical protein